MHDSTYTSMDGLKSTTVVVDLDFAVQQYTAEDYSVGRVGHHTPWADLQRSIYS